MDGPPGDETDTYNSGASSEESWKVISKGDYREWNENPVITRTVCAASLWDPFIHSATSLTLPFDALS